MNAGDPRDRAGFWTSKNGIALCVLVAIAALFVIIEHRVHALEWLPYALLLACPMLHLFTHGGHGGHAGHSHADGVHGAPRDFEDRDRNARES